MNKNLLIWSGPDFIHFCLSHSLKQKHDFNLFVLIDDADLGIKKFYNKQKFVNFSQQWYYYEHVKTNFQKPIQKNQLHLVKCLPVKNRISCARLVE